MRPTASKLCISFPLSESDVTLAMLCHAASGISNLARTACDLLRSPAARLGKNGVLMCFASPLASLTDMT